MKYGAIAHVNTDSTVNIRFADGYELDNVPTLNTYTPIQFEQVLVAEVEGGQVICLGSVYNAPEELA